MRAKTWLRAVLASLIVAAPIVLWETAAYAGLGVSPVPSFPTSTTVGDSFTGLLDIVNTSTPPESAQPITLTTITLTPGCSVNFPSPGCPGNADAGVFTLGSVGTGSGACAGITFAIALTSPGVYTFTPSAPIVLSAGQGCPISFPVTTSRVPTVDVVAATPGVQTNVLAGVAATSPFNPNVPFNGSGLDVVTVAPAPATIATTATPPRTDPGEPFSDIATVTGVPNGPRPTGTVTFALFGPAFIGGPNADAAGLPTCAGPPFATSGPIPLPAAGPLSVGSGNFGVAPPSTPGNYIFVATYSGDANYLGVTGPCTGPDAAGERVVVEPLPTIAIVKTARPTSRPEPGGTFDFDLLVTNLSPEPLTITSLTDRIGAGPNTNLAGRGTCALGAVLAADPDGAGPLIGGTYACTFPGTFTGLVTGPVLPTQTDTATVVGADNDTPPNTATASDDAVVSLTPTPPTIVVDKTATPLTRPEPGGSFTFPVSVRNTTPRPVTITTLTDTVGTPPVTINLNLPNPDPRVTANGCAGAVGQVLAADPDGAVGPLLGGVFNCSFTANYFSLVAGSTQTDIVRAVAFDLVSGLPAEDTDDAVVTVTDVLPTIVVDKTATPLSRPEPGGSFTFPVRVTNTSIEPVTITALTDSVGTPPVVINLNVANPDPRVTANTCVGAVGTVLAADPDGPGPALGGVYNCSFTASYFSLVAGSTQTDIVRAVAVDSENNPAEDTDDAVVTVTDVLPTIVVDKTATPLSRPEPGGSFTFPVRVTNTSIEPVTITALTDSVGTPPVVINLNVANPDPRVTANTCVGAVGTVLAADPDGPGPALGGVYNCSFTATYLSNVAGSTQTDIVRAVAVDSENNPAEDIDDAVVTVTDALPTILVDKTATPATRLEPGGAFTFNVVVTNTSGEPVTITTLTDSIGTPPVTIDLNLANPNPRVTSNGCAGAVGRSLTADPDGAGPLVGGTFTCAFTATFTGVAGASQTDTVTAVAVDNENNPATDTDDAIVSITNVVPTVTVEKTATPGSLPEPGGDFNFRVVVTNTSIIPVRITSLVDTVYGNLATRGTCTNAINQLLAANGGTYTCNFTGNVTGSAGDLERNVVTVVVTDDGGETATDDDDETVTLTGVPPTVRLVKTATPETRPAPGGVFTFNVVVTNTSTEDVTITALVDDIHGNIATQGTCTSAIGTVLSPNETYTCSFTATFEGASGSQRDVVTVTVVDDDDTPASANDDATITITPGVVVSQNVNQVPTTPNAPSSNPARTTPAAALPKTGAGVTDLLALAGGLLGLGLVFLLAASRWAPTAPTAAAAGAGSMLTATTTITTVPGRRGTRRFRERSP